MGRKCSNNGENKESWGRDKKNIGNKNENEAFVNRETEAEGKGDKWEKKKQYKFPIMNIITIEI